jgi:two-component system chemotaxis response regulator CheY
MTKALRILIVDDSYVARRVLVGQLKDLGYADVVEAKDGSQALTLLNDGLAKNETFGLIITDLQMPNMTGAEFLRKLGENPSFAKTPKLITSVETDRGTVLNAVMTGAEGYILKPTTVEVLKEKLDKILGQRRSAS